MATCERKAMPVETVRYHLVLEPDEAEALLDLTCRVGTASPVYPQMARVRDALVRAGR